jgi:type II restriction enzyme
MCAFYGGPRQIRRAKVAEQLQRPAFSRVSELGIRYLPYSQLEQNHASMSRFGSSIKPLLEISQRL